MFGTDSYSYDFDDIGNRISHEDAQGTQSYFSNELNQYTNITGGAAASPTYDLDGNMESDGKWSYEWNGENRLVAMQSKSLTNGAPRLEFAYDYMGRRFSKTVSAYDTVTEEFEEQSSRAFHYDGWNLVAETEFNPQSEIVNRKCYAWGLDLTKTLQGAGGVGGLLSQTHIKSASTNSYFPVCDANGNITEYVDESGDIAAHFEYDAFGRVTDETTASGLDGDLFAHRFSSKYEDVETGLNYYGFRYYAAGFGRWLSRDPIGERGGDNIMANSRNALVNYVDILGLNSSCNHLGDVDVVGITAAAAALMESLSDAANGDFGNEYCGNICKDKKCGKITFSKPVPGLRDGQCYPSLSPCEEGEESIGTYHSHPRNGDEYIGTPDGDNLNGGGPPSPNDLYRSHADGPMDTGPNYVGVDNGRDPNGGSMGNDFYRINTDGSVDVFDRDEREFADYSDPQSFDEVRTSCGL